MKKRQKTNKKIIKSFFLFLYSDKFFYCIAILIFIATLGLYFNSIGQSITVDEFHWFTWSPEHRFYRFFHALKDSNFAGMIVDNKPGTINCWVSGGAMILIAKLKHMSLSTVPFLVLHKWAIYGQLFYLFSIFIVSILILSKLMNFLFSIFTNLILIVAPTIRGINNVVNTDATAIAPLVPAFACCLIFWRRAKRSWLIPAGFLFALSFFSKHMAAMFPLTFFFLFDFLNLLDQRLSIKQLIKCYLLDIGYVFFGFALSLPLSPYIFTSSGKYFIKTLFVTFPQTQSLQLILLLFLFLAVFAVLIYYYFLRRYKWFYLQIVAGTMSIFFLLSLIFQKSLLYFGDQGSNYGWTIGKKTQIYYFLGIKSEFLARLMNFYYTFRTCNYVVPTLIISVFFLLLIWLIFIKKQASIEVKITLSFVFFFHLVYGFSLMPISARYLLPVYPFYLFLGGLMVFSWWQSARSKLTIFLPFYLVLITVGCFWESLLFQPSSLVFINAFRSRAVENDITISDNNVNYTWNGWGAYHAPIARYLNRKDGVEYLTVATDYPGFKEFFKGKTIFYGEEVDLFKYSDADYFIVSKQHLASRPQVMEYLRKNPQSEFVSSAGGVNYVWLFKVDKQ